jgi:hypothetical protein
MVRSSLTWSPHSAIRVCESRRVTRVANRNYLFIDLEVGADARPGQFELTFKRWKATSISYAYPSRRGANGSARREGFGSKDAIYQVMPDRFANGNPANDSVPAWPDKLDRANGVRPSRRRHPGHHRPSGLHRRHGFHQIWPTPLVEIAMPSYSYHGYAATDHYRIDPRYGSNEDFRDLVAQGAASAASA